MRTILVSCAFVLLAPDIFGRARSFNEDVFSAEAHQQIQGADLDGVVLSSDGRPLPVNVMVDLCDTHGVVIQQSATVGGGRFFFRSLKPVDYILKINADSYQSQEVRVNLEFGNVHGTVIYLKPVSSISARLPEGASTISSHELSMPAPAHELLVAGRKKLYRENKPQEALNDFLEALQKSPGFYELNYELGMAYVNLGQKEKARDCFAEAVASSKDTFAEPQIALGTLLVDQGNLSEGEKRIQRGIQLNPTLWMGYYQLARLEVRRGQLREAEVDAEKSRSLAPNAAINYQLLSVIHLRQREYPQLLKDIDRYLELDPNSPAAQRAKEVRDQVLKDMSGNLSGAISEVTVTIGVRDARGVPLEELATVRLTSKFGGVDHVSTTKDSSDVSFANVLKGPYGVVVECPGYRTVQADLDVTDDQGAFKSYIYMHALTDRSTSTSPPKEVDLTPKTSMEIDEGLAAMRKKQYESAQKHFTKASKSSPSNADVFYLRGNAELGLNQTNLAEKDFKQALAFDPFYERARLSLGELQLQSGDTAGAIETLNEAYVAHGANWRTHFLLATAYARTGDWKNAESRAQSAVNLAHEKAAPALLLLGDVQSAQENWNAARLSWERILTEFPKALEVTEAKKRITTAPGDGPAKDSTFTASFSLPMVDAELRRSVEDRPWAPADIDEKQYPLAPDISCNAEEILPLAMHRMQSQLENFEKFAATEHIEHQEIDNQGQPEPIKSRDFSYIVLVKRATDNSVFLVESRVGAVRPSAFPTSLATTGLNGLAVLLLQPKYGTGYAYQCQGLANVRGEAAWEIRFEEKKNANLNVRRWQLDGSSYNIPIKGLIWIAFRSYDVLRLETDLREPVDHLELSRDHLIVNYGPVVFGDGQSKLWLPWTAEMYLELHGARYHHKHSLTNYVMFNVDTSWKANKPKNMPNETIEETPKPDDQLK
jgi:tetratricopeptide (TPR) repeat protein